jgi:hypothetical protein
MTEVSGSCGIIPSAIVSVSGEGQVELQSITSCKSSETNECTTVNKDCSFSQDDLNYKITSDITFSSDGASAYGQETIMITGYGGGSCSSMYSISLIRQ